MATLQEIRQQYPQYQDMSDAYLAGALHRKFYSDMPREKFDELVGLKVEDAVMKRAREEYAADKARGIPVEASAGRRALQGMTFNTADEILAGLQTPLEMVKRGTFNPIEGYRSAKAAEDVALEDARNNGGVLGSVAEIGGGVMSGVGLGGAGLTAARMLAPNAGFLSRMGASAADGALFGGVAGVADGSGTEDRLTKGLQGAVLGGAVGGIVPAAISIGQQALNPVISNIRARLNPEGFARNQVTRSVIESGQSPQQLANAVAQASNEGQGMFTLADAMGNSGQRMLATTARSPGAARTDVVEFLEGRQAGQGRRLSNTLAEGFDSPQTAAQTEARLTAERSAAANQNYGAARQQAGSVDVTPAISEIDATLQPGVTRLMAPSNIADDSVEGVLRRARSMLTDSRSQVSRFDEAFRVKMELDNLIDQASPTQQRLLIPVRNTLDRQLEQASAPYAAARNQFREQSQNIESVQTGRTAAMRGRTEDTIPTYQGLRPDQQAAYRSGYVDPLIEQTQGAAFGVNKARPLTSDAFQSEAAVIAPGNPLMQRRIGRENTMFQTRNAATGNSKTAENLNDDAAMGIDPTMIGQILSGNVGGALRSAMSAVSNGWNGNTAGVREEVARILLQRGQNVNPASIQRMLDETMRRIETVATVARQIGRGASGGLAVAPGATGNRR
jgi:hypothetical protein